MDERQNATKLHTMFTRLTWVLKHVKSCLSCSENIFNSGLTLNVLEHKISQCNLGSCNKRSQCALFSLWKSFFSMPIKIIDSYFKVSFAHWRTIKINYPEFLLLVGFVSLPTYMMDTGREVGKHADRRIKITEHFLTPSVQKV